MNDTQKANVQRLIEHYEANPPIGWMYDQCAASVLYKWGITTNDPQCFHESILSDCASDVADALGIARDDAHLLVYKGYTGGEDCHWACAELPAYLHIVPSLKQLLQTGKFVWTMRRPTTT